MRLRQLTATPVSHALGEKLAVLGQSRAAACGLLRCLGRRGRLGRAAVTGIARDVRLPIREFAVDILRHEDHVPRDFLGMLIVAREIALHMTEVALHAERNRERSHGGNQILVGREDLQILGRRMLPERRD